MGKIENCLVSLFMTYIFGHAMSELVDELFTTDEVFIWTEPGIIWAHTFLIWVFAFATFLSARHFLTNIIRSNDKIKKMKRPIIGNER